MNKLYVNYIQLQGGVIAQVTCHMSLPLRYNPYVTQPSYDSMLTPTLTSNMPRDNRVLCTHCNQLISRQREREHRKLLKIPYTLPSPSVPSRVRPIVDSDSDDDGNINNNTVSAHEDHSGDDPHILRNDDNLEEPLDDIGVREKILWNHWAAGSYGGADDSETDSESNMGEAPYPQLEDDGEDSDEEGLIDWGAIEAQSGLSAWDQLGEGYEADAAALCKLHSIQVLTGSNVCKQRTASANTTAISVVLSHTKFGRIPLIGISPCCPMHFPPICHFRAFMESTLVWHFSLVSSPSSMIVAQIHAVVMLDHTKTSTSAHIATKLATALMESHESVSLISH